MRDGNDDYKASDLRSDIEDLTKAIKKNDDSKVIGKLISEKTKSLQDLAELLEGNCLKLGNVLNGIEEQEKGIKSTKDKHDQQHNHIENHKFVADELGSHIEYLGEIKKSNDPNLLAEAIKNKRESRKTLGKVLKNDCFTFWPFIKKLSRKNG